MQGAINRAQGKARQNTVDSSHSKDNENVRTLARRLQKSKHVDESTLLWQRVLQKNPKDTEAMNELGSACGRFEEGLQWFRRVLNVRPDFHAAKTNAGVALRHLGRLEEAVLALRDAVASNPDDEI